MKRLYGLVMLVVFLSLATVWAAVVPGTSLLSDAGKIQGTPVRKATSVDDGKALVFVNASGAYKLRLHSQSGGQGAVAWVDVTGKPSFATVASTGSYNDLVSRPSLATVATSGSYADIIGRPSLSTVATSGSYADLTNTPAAYSLPIASIGSLGGVKVGAGLSIDGTGILSNTAGGAPATSKYILQTADANLPNAQIMGLLGSGLVKNTTSTGAQSIAIPGTDYLVPSGSGAALTGITVSQVSGLVSSATTDTTNANNITSGTLSANRGGAGTINGLMKSNGSGSVSAAVAGTDYVTPTGIGTGLTSLNADNIASGTLNAARLPALNKAMVGLGSVPDVDATARTNHTGTQAISTVTGLQTALDGKLDSTAGVPISPASAYPATGDTTVVTPGYVSAAVAAGGGGGTWGSITGTLSAQTDLWDKFQTYLLTSTYNSDVAARAVRFTNLSTTVAGHTVSIATNTASIAANTARFANLSTSYNNLRIAVATAGIDTTPPVLTRSKPTSLVATALSNALIFNYTASDPQGLYATTPLYYSFNGGGNVALTSGVDSATLTAPAPNTAYSWTVTAKNAANMTTTESGTFTYQTAVLGLAPSTKDFGSVNTSSTGTPQTFTVTNTGLAVGNLGTFALSGTDAGQFTLGSNTCGSTLATGANCTMSVNFTPTSPGGKTATIGDGTHTAALSGTGTTIQYSDTFSDTATLSNWVKTSDSPAGLSLVYESGFATASNTTTYGEIHYFYVNQTTTTDQTIETTLDLSSDDIGSASLLFKAIDQNNYYELTTQSNNRVYIYKIVAGVRTSVGLQNITTGVNGPWKTKIVTSGSTFTVYFDSNKNGTYDAGETLSWSDSSLVGGTKFGMKIVNYGVTGRKASLDFITAQ